MHSKPAKAALAQMSAAAHDRVATFHDRLGASGQGDADEHQQLAEWHRRTAEADHG